MFSGIIQDIGMVMEAKDHAHGRTFHIATGLPEKAMLDGASVACNGVCLTATKHGKAGNKRWFAVDASHETLDRTQLDTWKKGTAINLESALKLGDPLDGHLVFGHVDTSGTITSIKEDGGNWLLTITAPKKLMPMLAEKGSISVDGVSLTVNKVLKNSFHVTVIPYTYGHTIIHHYNKGDKVHLEADMLARYVARMLGK